MASAGYSALQLLVVMGVSGLLAGAAAPPIVTMTTAFGARGAAREIYTELQAARAAAVMEGNRVRFRVLDGSTHRYEIHDDDDGDGVVDPWESVRSGDVRTLHPLVTIEATGPIVFVPDGQAPVSATVSLHHRDAGTFRVAVNAAGRIRIE